MSETKIDEAGAYPPPPAMIYTTSGPQAAPNINSLLGSLTQPFNVPSTGQGTPSLPGVNLAGPNPAITAPPYPSVQGQVMPNLNLAGIATPKTDLSGGNFSDSIPPQNIMVPPLSSPSGDANSDMFNLGIDPAVIYFTLNLAGNDFTIPSPAQLAATPDGMTVNAPTFGLQYYGVPPNKNFDLVGPGLDAIAPMMPDPQIPDLTSYNTPLGAMVIAATSNPMAIDPMSPDFALYDRPAGIFMPGPLMVDPLHPDLQFPITTQQVMMPDRPADLQPAAMQIWQSDPTYQMEPSGKYEELWMAQAGNNSLRERRQGMLLYGLDREEC